MSNLLEDRTELNPQQLVKLSFRLKNSAGEIIHGDIRYPAGREKLPAIFLLHGFTGSKDWGFFPYVSEKLSEHSAICITFNFSMDGAGSNFNGFFNNTKFSNNTISLELSDTIELINAFKDGIILGEEKTKSLWNGNIYMIGHSRGAAIALLSKKLSDSINKISLWASIAQFNRFSIRQRNLWKQKGFFEFKNPWAEQDLKMNSIYLEDLERNTKEFNLLDTAKELKIPVQIIHGLQDFMVLKKEADTLAAKIDKNLLDYVLVEHAGHTFGATHPFNGSTPALDFVINAAVEFFGLNLN